ncbi:cupin [Halovibrio salipaludis]|uniref:Cupin n=1 Tax=Halovibrio salipaludis TaxID=2032626 RepID=A0A2A2F6F6_9GAMM|nr:cupin domain-containing protein [Halovibrio salipaludis]PAU80113.1 cupin [Halovibrio salipaludis]
MENLLSSLPQTLGAEAFESIIEASHVRIERIVSRGHTSPDYGWYDQEEHEWILVLEGAGTVLFEQGPEIHLKKGDHLTIPAHARHRVSWTDPETVTVWLAVFYR